MSIQHPVATWIEHHARAVPDRLALRHRLGSRLTYADLDRRANQVANAMVGLGMQPGDRVALWMDDSLVNVEIYVAAAKIGAVLVPINARLQSAEADYIFEQCEPRIVIYADNLADRLDRSRAASSSLGGTLWATGDERVGSARFFESDVKAASHRRPDPVPYSPEDTYLIAFSSGTTGRPKGAATSGRGVENSVVLSALARRLNFFDTALITTSVSFPATIVASILTNLYMANTMVFLGAGWNVDQLLDIAERDRANFVSIPSPFLLDFTHAAKARPAALNSLRSVLHSGSKVPARDLAALHDVVGSRLIEVWGMVESGGPITATAVGDYLRVDEVGPDLFASVGHALPQCEVALADPDGNPLPHDASAVGELVVRSPALMTGYWNNPEATAHAFRGGYYHTGDLGIIDPDGLVSIVDRRHDLIVSGGANIYPSEVERVLLDCPGVQQAVVVGVPHERWGRTAVAAIVPAPNTGLNSYAVLSFVQDRLASYKKPTQIKFVTELPVNSSGKIQRDQVAALFEPNGA